MSLDKFERHLAAPAPGFRCYPSGARAAPLKWIAHVTNLVGKPGTASAIAIAKKTVGRASPSLIRFVELHDGVTLYRDSKPSKAFGGIFCAGIEFFKARQWNSRTNEMRESTTAMGFAADEMPEWFQQRIAVATIPYSANYFVMQSTGKQAGKIFYCDHDDAPATKPMAKSFADLLRMIVADPVDFMYRGGCYTRYSDGKTHTQWIPREYVADCGNA